MNKEKRFDRAFSLYRDLCNATKTNPDIGSFYEWYQLQERVPLWMNEI